MLGAALVAAGFGGLLASGRDGGAGVTGSGTGVARIRLVDAATIGPGHHDGDPAWRVGGLSGLDWDSARGVYVVISDDRADIDPVRLGRLTIEIGPEGFGEIGRVRWVELVDASGRSFGRNEADGEAVRVRPDTGTIVWASEGRTRDGVAPGVFEVTREGVPLGTFDVPRKFLPEGADLRRGVQASGVRNNRGFESLAITPDGAFMFVGAEEPLAQDEGAAAPGEPGYVRVVRYGLSEGRSPEAEFAYRLGPPPFGLEEAPKLGLAELIALGPTRLLALERQDGGERGFGARLFLVELAKAVDVSGVVALTPPVAGAVTKRLLADLTELGAPRANFEGMTLGPRLGAGDLSLIVMSDDDFEKGNETVFLLLSVAELLLE